MKLRNMLELLGTCNCTVKDLDSGLRTDCIPSWELDNPQLRTLLDKVVKVVFPEIVKPANQPGIVLEVAKE